MVNENPEAVDRVFHALASDPRRRILQRLSHGDYTVAELAEPFDMSTAAVSKNLTVLENAGLISRTRRGRQTLCHLNPAALQQAADVLDYYRSFWSDQLDSLNRFLNQEKAGT